MTAVSLEEIAKIYRDNIWKIHRVPKKIHSNRGPQFSLLFIEDLSKTLGMKQMLSTTYYPQTDSQTERINQEVEAFLQHYVNYQQDDWTEWSSAAEFQYNNKNHSAAGYTPFKLNFGRHPWKGDLTIKTELPKLETFLEELQRSWKAAKILMEKAKEAIKKHSDKKR